MTSMQMTNGAAVFDAGLTTVNYTTLFVRQTGAGIFEFVFRGPLKQSLGHIVSPVYDRLARQATRLIPRRLQLEFSDQKFNNSYRQNFNQHTGFWAADPLGG